MPIVLFTKKPLMYTPTLRAIAKKYSLDINYKYGYYEGDVYNNTKGESLPSIFELNGVKYRLEYFSGCFNPFFVQVSN